MFRKIGLFVQKHGHSYKKFETSLGNWKVILFRKISVLFKSSLSYHSKLFFTARRGCNLRPNHQTETCLETNYNTLSCIFSSAEEQMLFSNTWCLKFYALKHNTVAPSGPGQQQQQNVNLEKMMRRFTKAATFDGLIVFLIGPLLSGALVLFRNTSPDFALTFGQYAAPLCFSVSTFSFISYILFMNSFRRELLSTFSCAFVNQPADDSPGIALQTH